MSREMTIVVTNAPQQFNWEGSGLRLHISGCSLPEGLKQCTVDIKASLSGQYGLPKDSHLVSGMYWFRCEPQCKFVKPITVEIQHCASDTSKLGFVKAFCTQKTLPYTFKPIEGHFTSNSSYGIIELNSFSGLGIVQEGSEDHCKYIASQFYSSKEINHDIHFVVTMDLSLHQFVSCSYSYKI